MEIKKDDVLYAVVLKKELIPHGNKWYGDPTDTLQLLSRKMTIPRKKNIKMLETGYAYLKPHSHKKVMRTVEETQECFIVIVGNVKAMVYDNENKKIDEVKLSSGDCVVFYRGGHGYKVISNNLIAYEIKAGKFVDDKVMIGGKIEN